MYLCLRVLWAGVTALGVAAIVWFIMGTTANFQRHLDLIATFDLVYLWVPSVILTLMSIRLLIKGWLPTGVLTFAGLLSGGVLLIFLSVLSIQSVNTEGWLTEIITSDSLKITSDGKYEYRLDLVNLFQKNSKARLYVRDVSTGEEKNISIDFPTNEIWGLRVNDDINWVIMEPTDVPEHYLLYTTEELGSKFETRKYEIDISTGTSMEIN